MLRMHVQYQYKAVFPTVTTQKISARLEVLTAVLLFIYIFTDIKLYHWVNGSRRFESSMLFFRKVRNKSPNDTALCHRRCESLASTIYTNFRFCSRTNTQSFLNRHCQKHRSALTALIINQGSPTCGPRAHLQTVYIT